MWIPDCACLMFESWVLNESWVIDFSSALVGMLKSLSKLFLFRTKLHLISGVRLIGIVVCYSHQTCCHLYYLGEINSSIHMEVAVVSDLNKNFGKLTDLTKKRQGSADLHTPIHPSPPPPLQ